MNMTLLLAKSMAIKTNREHRFKRNFKCTFLSSFINYQHILNKNYTAGAISGAEELLTLTEHPNSPGF
jgi:hypothetical protein